ncbi:unnamed protein product [Meganyctiphanes norvegica]|uniref:UDP-glucuronosyltransferase n=1 Tax=Meganyctiphanes norvegica TaxID=48144 RepID=A0AAV2R509_MEGNR
MKLWLVSTLILSWTPYLHTYNILMLAPFGSWSEYQLAKTIAETLTGVGHQVTLVSEFKSSRNSSVKEIVLGSPIIEEHNYFEWDIMTTLYFLKELQNRISHMMYTNENIMEIWKNRNKFDAIIAYSNGNEIVAPFLIDYEGAYIGLCAMGIESKQIVGQGNRLPTSVTPYVLTNFDENMTFFQRVVNLLIELIVNNSYDYGIVPEVQTLLENYFPGMPPVADLYMNFSLLLINSHFAMDGMYPLLPNQVEIGTLTARLPQPLSKELLEFIDAAENGVIYFSLGSVAKSTDIPKPQLVMLLEAFRQLPQHVIWKLEADHIEDLPSNVIIGKWLPQQDILGHPKTLLFISHCGIFGTQEAKYHGVPVLGVPISLDQYRNAAVLAKKGYGRVLNWSEMSVDSILENINTLINDTSYNLRIKAVSKALKDQMESPNERVLWWIEYAIRHKDAPHMQYAAKNLNFIQYHMIDVWVFLIAIMLLWLYLSSWCLRKCCNTCQGSKSKQE